jgi:hypothetical protein
VISGYQDLAEEKEKRFVQHGVFNSSGYATTELAVNLQDCLEHKV